ncbi:MAG: hypothetical protein HOV66_20455, partial [Streptomycetaceae bacterium]|nr:hypothetical protein [Streptomycetaceae bacterium]
MNSRRYLVHTGGISVRRMGVAVVASALLASLTSATITATPAVAARSGAPQQLTAAQPVTVPLITGDSVRLSGTAKVTAAAQRVTATAQVAPGRPAIRIT